MTMEAATLVTLLARFVEHHVRTGDRLDIPTLCDDRGELVAPLGAMVDRYLSLATTLGGDEAVEAPLPEFDGFQTIERIGAGGMGEVYKLRDLRLNRTVAGKVLRRPAQRGVVSQTGDFLREARALALFTDRRIVQIFDVRPDTDPPLIVMEFVDGFELGRVGRSLDFPQRARVMTEICEAVHHAHQLGVTHRDLKPSNVMLDAQLTPRILDFGLSGSDPQSGHLKGTVPYVAPEQLDPSNPIDARTDVYGLGTILYELLCGCAPYADTPDEEVLHAIREGRVRLPIEIDPRIPEPLQAIALVAMERDPAKRYQTALEMASDLKRVLDSRPVLARPSAYGTTLTARARRHLTDVEDWQRLRLIYPHEAQHLRDAYRALDAREDDWIVESRTLSYPQIALYLGAFLLVAGSLFYFVAARIHEAVDGMAGPFAVLALPFIGLNVAAHLLYARDHRVVAIAFYLGAILLLPLFLLILFHETGLLLAPAGAAGQLFPDGAVSNRQLQITTIAAALWCGWLALRTRTTALSTVFQALLLAVTLAILADLGLRDWVEQQRWDRLSLHLFPLVAAYGGLGAAAERTGRLWMSRPAYIAGALLFVIVLELVALDGRAFAYLRITLRPLQPADVSNEVLLDTIAAMTINGAIFYAVAAALDRRRADAVRGAAALLFTVAPFALLKPLGYLVQTTEYSPRIDWMYAIAAAVIMLLSHARQRKSFYYAGLLNLAIALYLIASRRQWFDEPVWAVMLVLAGLVALGAGLALHRRERRT